LKGKADDIPATRIPRPGGSYPTRGPIRMEPEKERQIRDQLVKLGLEHRELDNEIAALEAAGMVDQLQISRLKRRKLKLKDQMTTLEDQLLPDIIA
jgi:hypothetical protein